MSRSATLIPIVLLLTLVAGWAAAATEHAMTFDTAAFEEDSPYVEGAQTLTGLDLYCEAIAAYGPGKVATGKWSPGTATLTATDGKPFDFLSMDFDEVNSAIGPRVQTFVGHKVDGSTVTETFTTDGVHLTMETFVPTEDFTDLTSLDITIKSCRFDNIRSRQADTMRFDDAALVEDSPYVEGAQTLTGLDLYCETIADYGPGKVATGKTSPGTATLTANDGKPFDFLSMDFDEVNSAIGPRVQTFVGHKVDGSAVTETFTTDGVHLTMETFVPTEDFTDLTSLDITIKSCRFDNIRSRQADTMRFDDAASEENSPYVEGAQTLTGLDLYCFSDAGYGIPGQVAVGKWSPGTATLTRTDTEPFDFLSMDFDEVNSAIGPKVQTFVGHRVNGTTVTETFTTDGVYHTMETFVPTKDFTNLTSLDITIRFCRFDHIRSVTAPPLIPGDADLDGDVDLDDFSALKNGFGTGTTLAEGDFDGDGDVDLDDFTILKNNFGT